jgi:hypothetical protein
VIAHGLGRTTKDIDLLVDDDPRNIALVKEGLKVLADQAALELADEDVRTYTVVRVADEVMVDLLGQACGIGYAEAARDSEIVEIEGVPVPAFSPATYPV